MGVAVLQDYRVNNLSTKDASPSEKFFAVPVEFFIGHGPTAPLASHNCLPFARLYSYGAISVPT